MFNYLTGVVRRLLAPVNHIDYNLQRHRSLIRNFISVIRGKRGTLTGIEKREERMFKIEAHQPKALI